MTPIQQFCEFLVLLLLDLHQFYAPDLCLTISQTIDLIENLWLLGTFSSFSPDLLPLPLTLCLLPTTMLITLLLHLFLTAGYPAYLPSKKRKKPPDSLQWPPDLSTSDTYLCFLTTSFCGLFTFLFPSSRVLVCGLPLPHCWTWPQQLSLSSGYLTLCALFLMLHLFL
jgi:hypothetical protein